MNYLIEIFIYARYDNDCIVRHATFYQIGDVELVIENLDWLSKQFAFTYEMKIKRRYDTEVESNGT